MKSVHGIGALDAGVLGQYYTIKPAFNSADSITKCSNYQRTEEANSYQLHLLLAGYQSSYDSVFEVLVEQQLYWLQSSLQL